MNPFWSVATCAAAQIERMGIGRAARRDEQMRAGKRARVLSDSNLHPNRSLFAIDA